MLVVAKLTHSFPMHPFSTPKNIRKPSGFLMFSGGGERVHWERIGYFTTLIFDYPTANFGSLSRSQLMEQQKELPDEADTTKTVRKKS